MRGLCSRRFCGKIESVTHNGSDAKVNFVKVSTMSLARGEPSGEGGHSLEGGC